MLYPYDLSIPKHRDVNSFYITLQYSSCKYTAIYSFFCCWMFGLFPIFYYYKQSLNAFCIYAIVYLEYITRNGILWVILIFTFVKYCLINYQNIWPNLLSLAIFLFIKQWRSNPTDNGTGVFHPAGIRECRLCMWNHRRWPFPEEVCSGQAQLGTLCIVYRRGTAHSCDLTHLQRSMEESESSEQAVFIIKILALLAWVMHQKQSNNSENL